MTRNVSYGKLRFDQEEIKRILVINLGGIGDVLLSLPALKSLRKSYPHARLVLLTVPHVSELKTGVHFIDEFISWYVDCKPAHIARNIITVRVLREEKFDVLINMRTLVSPVSALKMRLLIDCIKPRVTVGRDTEGRGSFFDIRIPETDIGRKYERDYDIETVRALGCEGLFYSKMDFVIDKKDADKVEKFLQAHGVNRDSIIIGIHPGGAPSRRWPVEYFAQCIRTIHPCVHGDFVITGVEKERHLAEQLEEMAGIRLINTAGIFSIYELGALICRCSVYISNDTGPMHLAAFLKTPLVAIFGPGDVRRFDPRNISERAAVLYKKTACSPCNRVQCNSLACLKALEPAEIVSTALELLQKNNCIQKHPRIEHSAHISQ